MANSGHFNVELDLDGLARIASERRMVRNLVEEYVVKGRRIMVLGEGRLFERAIEVFQFVVSGWSDELGGGVYWRESDRTTGRYWARTRADGQSRRSSCL